VPTPATKTIADVSKLLGVDATRCVKTLIVEGSDGGVVAMVIRGDHEMNAVKAQKVAGVASPLRMATAQRVLAGTGTEPGFLGPVGLKCRIVVDHAAAALADFVCGANARDAHLTGVNWGRDLPSRKPPTCAMWWRGSQPQRSGAPDRAASGRPHLPAGRSTARP
jgi:prolyl-tRNA synthetase